MHERMAAIHQRLNNGTATDDDLQFLALLPKCAMTPQELLGLFVKVNAMV
jgi:hypothetical protein